MLEVARVGNIESRFSPEAALRQFLAGRSEMLLNGFMCPISLYFPNGVVSVGRVPLIAFSVALDYAFFSANIGDEEGIVFVEDQRLFSLSPIDNEFIISTPSAGRHDDLCFLVREGEVKCLMREVVRKTRKLFMDVQDMKGEAHVALPHNMVLRHIFDD